jgi:hypothetical protein
VTFTVANMTHKTEYCGPKSPPQSVIIVTLQASDDIQSRYSLVFCEPYLEEGARFHVGQTYRLELVK